MPKYGVYAQWAVGGYIEVEANDKDHALAIAEEADLGDFDAEYIDGSFEIPEYVDVEVLENARKRSVDIEDDISISPNANKG